jgi:hypothetical protein
MAPLDDPDSNKFEQPGPKIKSLIFFSFERAASLRSIGHVETVGEERKGHQCTSLWSTEGTGELFIFKSINNECVCLKGTRRRCRSTQQQQMQSMAQQETESNKEKKMS